MKKLLLAILILVFVTSWTFAITGTRYRSSGIQIGGYISVDTQPEYLVISPFIYASDNGGKGINLDYTDTSSPYYKLLEPSDVTQAGLLIGNFSIYTEKSNKLVITHTPLQFYNDDEYTRPNPSKDQPYELGIELISNVSTDRQSKITTGDIDFLLYDSVSRIIVRDGSIYIRLVDEVPQGYYKSDITFELVSL
ncbi:MAG: hypothetical protein HUK24_05140 [Sphaerochaetaceae bacterium]|nr:hypothetical protein [Sphaerochaetaceae bacterium]